MDSGEAWGGLGRLGETEEFETLLGFPGISAECGECAAAVMQLSDSMRLTKAIQVPKPRLSETTTSRMHEFNQASVHPAIAMPIR